MPSRYTEDYICPQCKTFFRATIISGIQPRKTEESVDCPVCWCQVDHKNITGDVGCEVISTEMTIEPYKSEYIKN